MRYRSFDWMLVSDLDGTLLGDDEALVRFREEWNGRLRAKGCLVYASGRFVSSMRKSFEKTNLPEPDFWIGGVGSEIGMSDGRPLPGWWDLLKPGWNKTAALRILQAWPGVELQPEEFQGPYKVSGYWHNASPEQVGELKAALLQNGCRARVIYSSRRDIDLLPAAAGKGTSAAFIARSLAIPFKRVVCSGDSGNDTDLFMMGFGGGILVGNASPDLVAAAPRAYQAVSVQAAGVLEGLKHYGWLK